MGETDPTNPTILAAEERRGATILYDGFIACTVRGLVLTFLTGRTYGIDVWAHLGIGFVVLFVGTRLIAVRIYQLKHYEEIGFALSRKDKGASGGTGFTG